MQFHILYRSNHYKFEILKPNMAASSILKIRKIAISRSLLERFRQNLAWLRSSTLFTVPNVKKFQIVKIQDGGGRHVKKSKNHHILAAIQAISTKFGTHLYFDLLDLFDR